MKPAISKPQPPPNICAYRRKTIAVLRRYFNKSVELGRLPSILGRELLPAAHVRCHPVSFEGFVVFVLDIERCLSRLRRPDQQLISRVILQEYTQEEAARLLGWSVIRIERRLPEVLDILGEMFLTSGLMKRFPDRTPVESDESDATPPAEGTSVADSIFAFDEAGGEKKNTVAVQETVTNDDFRCVPVEIVLSSPLDVTNLFNSHVQ